MIYAFEDFTIDTDRFQLAGPDGIIEGEPQALEFLIHMIRNRGQLVTKETLHQTFWPDRVVSDAALSNLVRNARRLVGDTGEEQRIIATRHGRGFVFRADIREVAGPDALNEAMRDLSHQVMPRIQGAPAIMVLPFEIVGTAEDAGGLGEGVTEEVMAALARTRWFPLIARNRVRTFLELPAEARHPFKGLGATYLIEGGVFRDGDEVRLHLQLTDTAPAVHIHVSRHDLTYCGLFKLLDEIATIVSATILPELLDAERIKSEAFDPDQRSAWQEFVLAQHLIAAPDKAANEAARAHFERALAMERGAGRIHAGLAMTHLWDYKYGWSDSAELSLGAAARDAERALSLAPDDSWAWSILAICKLTLRRFDAAMSDSERAIEVDPASAMAHGCHSWILAYSGRYRDALSAFDRAMTLSPRDRRRGLWLTGRGIAQFGLGDFAGALASARELIALSPDHPSGHRMKCASLACLGQDAEAQRAAASLMTLLPDHDVDEAIARQPFKSNLGDAYAAALKKAGLTGGTAGMSRVPASAISAPSAPAYPINNTTTKDGVRIAWSRIGSGPPLLACVRWPGNLALDHENPLSADVVRRLSQTFTLVQFDHRGMGASQREIESLSLGDMATDIEAAVDAAGLQRFSLFTMAHDCAAAFEYIRRNANRVERLVVFGACSTGWRHPEWGDITERTEAVRAIARLGWDREEPTFRRLTIQAIVPEISPDVSDWLDHYLKRTISARMSVQVIDAIADFDFRPMLSSMKTPTLVVHARDNLAVPIAHGRRVAEAIPGAAFREAVSRNGAFSQIDPDWETTLEDIIRFLDPT